MRRIFVLLMALILIVMGLASCQSEQPPANGESESQSQTQQEETTTKKEEEMDPYVEMITYNIAFYQATAANMTVYYQNQGLADYTIERRAERLSSMVAHYMPDVLALQEVNHLWWPYLISGDNAIVKKYDYSWTGNLSAYNNKNGVGSTRDDDIYNLLLWNPEKFEEIKSGVFRLTSEAKNANKDRMCSYAILRNRDTGVETLYASTHICTRSNETMTNLSISQVTKLTNQLKTLADGRMIIIGGDFNSHAQDPPYRYMTETAKYSDARLTAEMRRTPLMCSARVWGREGNWNNGKKTPIDHIFFLGDTAIADEWTVMTDTYDINAKISTDLGKIGVNYDLSDHQGIYVKFKEIVK